jgi:DNA gyrase subunit B
MRRATENLTLEIHSNGSGAGGARRRRTARVSAQSGRVRADVPQSGAALRDRAWWKCWATSICTWITRPSFQEEANLKPVFEALEKLGLKPEMRRDEEHSSYAVVFHDSTNAERSVGLALAAQPEYRRFRALAPHDHRPLQRSALRGGQERKPRGAAQLARAARLREDRRQEGTPPCSATRASAK